MVQREKNNVKPADIIILILALVLSCSVLIFTLFFAKTGKIAVIEVDGTEYARQDLSLLSKEKVLDIKTEYGYNKVILDKSGVYVSYADCPDKIDVKKGKISKTGESIVCLPNRLLIYIEGDASVDSRAY